MRIATFNVENLDSNDPAFLARRIQIMRPQLLRVDADILCLQECHSEEVAGVRQLDALNQLIANTDYENFNLAHTTTAGGDLYAERNLVTLSRVPITNTQIIRDNAGPRPSYQQFTANPPDAGAGPPAMGAPILYTQHDIGNGRTLHVLNVHLKSKLPQPSRARRSTISPGERCPPGRRAALSHP